MYCSPKDVFWYRVCRHTEVTRLVDNVLLKELLMATNSDVDKLLDFSS